MPLARKLDTLEPERMDNKEVSHTGLKGGHGSFSEDTIADGFEAFLCRKKGKSRELAKEMRTVLREYLANEVPEIAAVAFLRDDFHRPELVSKAPRYDGQATDGPALDYLRTHYAKEIARGTLTTSTLKSADPKLFSAVDYELRKPSNKVYQGMVVGTLELRAERREKWGLLLGTSDTDEVTKYAMLFKDRRAGREEKAGTSLYR